MSWLKEGAVDAEDEVPQAQPEGTEDEGVDEAPSFVKGKKDVPDPGRSSPPVPLRSPFRNVPPPRAKAVPSAPAPRREPKIDAPPAPVPVEEVPGSSSLARLKAAVPQSLRSSVTQVLADRIESISEDPRVAEAVREGFVSYGAILRDGKFKVEDYLNAVTFVSHKLMKRSNDEAYRRTFPDRVREFEARGSKDISPHVSMFARNKLVNLILEQSLVPTWILNQDLHQEGINVLAKIARDEDASNKVRVDAAIGLINATRKPDSAKAEVAVELGESAGLREMRDALTQLARAELRQIERGEARTIDVAGKRLFEREAEDV